MIADLDLNPISLLTTLFTWALQGLHTIFHTVPLLDSVGAFGLAVIVLTLVLRTFLFPLFAWQLRATRRSQTEMAKVAPQLAELKRKYKGQPQKFSAEMQKLYREHGISQTNQLQGCVPTLLQLPILWGLYGAIRGASSSVGSDRGFLWIHDVTLTVHQSCCLLSDPNASTQVWTGVVSGLVHHPLLLILPVLAGIATFVQARMMLMPLPDNATAQQQSMQQMSQTVTSFMPLMITVMAYNFAQGIALYWVTQSIYMIVQQYYLVGWGAITMPVWFPGAHRETNLTHEGHRRQRNVRVAALDTTDTNTGGTGVVASNGSNNGTGSGPEPSAPAEPPRTKVMGKPVGSPSRMDKGSGARKRRR